MAYQGGFAGTQIAFERDAGAQVRASGLHAQCQRSGEVARVLFIRPGQSFYNRAVKLNSHQFVSDIQVWARELGFSQIGVAGVDLSTAEPGLSAWLAAGFHGDMHFMAAHGLKRARPAELVPGTVSVITARMDYLPAQTPELDADWQSRELARLTRPTEAVVSVYARGRDYHKVLRARLQKLAERIAQHVGPFGHRAFTDSAPVLEVELAERSGQGWRGKHTLLLNREAGSMFFLGEIYVDLALPHSQALTPHCGACNACITVCPTQAIVAAHRLDARRCISYLTIEHAGPIPLELRPLMGNRIYGCDDCQLVCPWNKFAQRNALPDFDERAGLTGQQLCTLWGWSEAEFLRHTEGSPIHRIGHERWLRNLAVAMGNALRSLRQRQADPAALAEQQVLQQALRSRLDDPSTLLQDHLQWALAQGD
ncbi:MAG: tRNA epoxyqueuosine(34) reductase QueG [Rhodoferax sp.]|nr:tRNA epoxyqueuosine(34) reductase QueG [Rhodoferax sp.]